jgi:hypothetical protein
MKNDEAETIARQYLASLIELVQVPTPVGGYRACSRPDAEHLYFNVMPDSGQMRVGGAHVLAVSQVDGHVDDLGMCGE